MNLQEQKEKQYKYWRDRQESEFLAGEKDILTTAKELQVNYKSAMARIEKELDAFYGKYAKGDNLELLEAKKLLRPGELKDFKLELKEYLDYIKADNYNKDFADKIKEILVKSKVPRLEMLKLRIEFELSKLNKASTNLIEEKMHDLYENCYYESIYDLQHNTGIPIAFNRLADKTIEKAISKNYVLANYSINPLTGIWQNQEKLMMILNQAIPQGITLGYNPTKLARLVSKKLDTNYNNTVRLLRTEYNVLFNEASVAGYKECGLDQYQILATLDDRTSEICQDMDLQIFKLSEREVGVNYPPFHPNCRTTTIPYFEPDEFDEEKERIARDNNGEIYYIPSTVNYKEWKAHLVEQPDGSLRYEGGDN